MSKKFDNVAVGDQLELPANKGFSWYPGKTSDPHMTIAVSIVTHIWFDPVDDKKYVGLSYLKADGSFGKPTEKRTITGLARFGWRRASIDWVSNLQAVSENEAVIPLWRQR